MSATAEERLARIEAQLAGLNQRLDEVVISQLKDHGKRLAALERRQVRRGRGRGRGHRGRAVLSGQISGRIVTISRLCPDNASPLLKTYLPNLTQQQSTIGGKNMNQQCDCEKATVSVPVRGITLALDEETLAGIVGNGSTASS